MSKQSKPKTIKPLEGYNSMADEEVVSRGTAVATAIPGNPNFHNPPVDPAALKAGLDSLSALIAEARDGSKKVIAQKNKQRHAVIKMLRLLGRYVEVACKEDMAIFKSSGFEPASMTKTLPAPLAQPTLKKLKHGTNTGQLLAEVKAVPKALSYELREGVVGSGGTPATWTNHLVTSVRKPFAVNGLTPGAIYAFQVRAMGKLGYTDWSDSVTCMCT